jgi:hypothetical protein
MIIFSFLYKHQSLQVGKHERQIQVLRLRGREGRERGRERERERGRERERDCIPTVKFVFQMYKNFIWEIEKTQRY